MNNVRLLTVERYPTDLVVEGPTIVVVASEITYASLPVAAAGKEPVDFVVVVS